jgi:hypothetical protein
VVAEHTRDVADTPARATAIKAAARGWAEFWEGHLDLDTLAVDVTEHLADLQESRARVERFTSGRGHGADRRTGPWAGPVASMQRTTTARTASWQSQRTEEPPWHRRPDVPDPLEAALLPGEGDHNCEIVSFINFRRVASPDGRENCSYATSG